MPHVAQATHTLEKPFKPFSGALALLLFFAALGGIVFGFVQTGRTLQATHGASGGVALVFLILAFAATFISAFGFFIVNPNDAKVMVLFGTYKGTVRANGFWWCNPFTSRKRITVRARNLEGEKLKVNDKLGNPIDISAVVVWRVSNTAQALFDVEDYVGFVSIQSEAAVRQLAGTYPYDNHDDDDAETNSISLREGREQVNHVLEEQLAERLAQAGVEIVEARLTHLAYAPEIAGAMLQRQQATAVVAARTQIVDGAVGMVRMALERLADQGILTLDEERKAAMVSNLLVVLCGDRSPQPVVNTGSLYT